MSLKNYSGFPSAQLESYYSRIQLKMIEFLSDVIITLLKSNPRLTAFPKLELLPKASSNLPTEEKEDLASLKQAAEGGLTEEQMERFIKKALKIYKALRVLERNKNPDTPFFSKSLDKLIRYFTKQYPAEADAPQNGRNLANLSSKLGGNSDKKEFCVVRDGNTIGASVDTRSTNNGSGPSQAKGGENSLKSPNSNRFSGIGEILGGSSSTVQNALPPRAQSEASSVEGKRDASNSTQRMINQQLNEAGLSNLDGLTDSEALGDLTNLDSQSMTSNLSSVNTETGRIIEGSEVKMKNVSQVQLTPPEGVRQQRAFISRDQFKKNINYESKRRDSKSDEELDKMVNLYAGQTALDQFVSSKKVGNRKTSHGQPQKFHHLVPLKPIQKHQKYSQPQSDLQCVEEQFEPNEAELPRFQKFSQGPVSPTFNFSQQDPHSVKKQKTQIYQDKPYPSESGARGYKKHSTQSQKRPSILKNKSPSIYHTVSRPERRQSAGTGELLESSEVKPSQIKDKYEKQTRNSKLGFPPSETPDRMPYQYSTASEFNRGNILRSDAMLRDHNRMTQQAPQVVSSYSSSRRSKSGTRNKQYMSQVDPQQPTLPLDSSQTPSFVQFQVQAPQESRQRVRRNKKLYESERSLGGDSLKQKQQKLPEADPPKRTMKATLGSRMRTPHIQPRHQHYSSTTKQISSGNMRSSITHGAATSSSQNYQQQLTKKALNLVYNNQANIHNNIIMRQQKARQSDLADFEIKSPNQDNMIQIQESNKP